jgi:predicted phosphate transport protein (TIGR00153 family)
MGQNTAMGISGYVYSIFGKSPIAALQAHIDVVVDCVERLPSYFRAVGTGNWEQAAEIHGQIDALEKEADRIKNELRMHLPSSLLLPVDRRDMLELVDLQDDMANTAKDIAGLVLGRRLTLPAGVVPLYLTFLERCVDASRHARLAVNELDELVETGFRGAEANRVKSMIEDLQAIEDETDSLQVDLRMRLYAVEDGMNPVDVMFIYEIINWTGDLADTAKSTGNRLQLMLAR